ncbi:hypothetical protein BZA05DRAFT_122560 [Tricharina praecox]|uniref:uncharacterized protein n=1 Tax=Tricharina praecox TaxID=43433 RepID=UPI0022203A5B|nr:uncharacterized protein BZA05DRAFT_183356 [Tricharina praecox]XP_051337655.1 uncharacterized protein BZA05DRAFT_122560 [Tricharina praecox]KAI5843652.1 hypothetical protein BZA05DRAFT_183356 [Tricharina praecox]KAI5848210.1 hypothetical protein BZA05DRAFT_122560 [Tricharina praecox]
MTLRLGFCGGVDTVTSLHTAVYPSASFIHYRCLFLPCFAIQGVRFHLHFQFLSGFSQDFTPSRISFQVILFLFRVHFLSIFRKKNCLLACLLCFSLVSRAHTGRSGIWRYGGELPAFEFSFSSFLQGICFLRFFSFVSFLFCPYFFTFSILHMYHWPFVLFFSCTVH